MFGKKTNKKQETNQLRNRASHRSQFNYYANNAQHAQRKEKPNDDTISLGSIKYRLRLAPTFIALAVIGLSLLMSLTLSSRPSVSTLNSEDSPYRKLDDYAVATEELLSRDLSSKTKLSINTREVEDQLLKLFPELRAAVLRLPVLGRKPSLIIAVEPPVLLLVTNSKSYVLDSSGMVVGEAQTLDYSVRASLLILQDQSGIKLEIGKQAITTETVSFITEATAQLKAKNQSVSQLTLPQSANRLDIYLSSTSYYIKTDVAGSARLQIGSFLAVKDRLEGEGVTPLEYIDVRVEEKVFYK